MWHWVSSLTLHTEGAPSHWTAAIQTWSGFPAFQTKTLTSSSVDKCRCCSLGSTHFSFSSRHWPSLMKTTSRQNKHRQLQQQQFSVTAVRSTEVNVANMADDQRWNWFQWFQWWWTMWLWESQLVQFWSTLVHTHTVDTDWTVAGSLCKNHSL